MAISLSPILFIYLSLLCLITPSVSAIETHKNQIGKRGGKCLYQSYPGVATITHLHQLNKIVSPLPYYGFEIKFRFIPAKHIPEKYSPYVEKEHDLTLLNSWKPGPRFIEKYGIYAEKKFNCIMKIQEQGTCTPILFEFQKIDKGDYFETKENNSYTK